MHDIHPVHHHQTHVTSIIPKDYTLTKKNPTSSNSVKKGIIKELRVTDSNYCFFIIKNVSKLAIKHQQYSFQCQ